MSDDVSLYVVALQIDDAKRRARLRDILRWQGEAVGRDAYEVPATHAGMQRLRNLLAAELKPGDEARIYPVCGRCRQRAALFGTENMASLPHAWIF